MIKSKISFLIIGLFVLGVFFADRIEASMFNKVVAVVNDEVITQQDIDQLLGVLYAQYVQNYKGDELLAKMEEVKKDILNQVIEDKLILSRAKELDIKVPDEEVNERLDEIKRGFPSEEIFEDTLKTQGVTINDLKNRYTDQLMMKKVVNFEIKSKVGVLPSEITDYFEKHKDEFRQDEQYKVSQILIKALDDVGFGLAEVEIRDIYNKLVEGQDFEGLALKHSEGPNKENGGDMGYIRRGEMLEELEAVIFSLKKGEFSQPVRSKIGYHIFRVDDIMNSGYMPLEQVRGDIEKFLFQQKLQEKVNEWIKDLRSKAVISVK